MGVRMTVEYAGNLRCNLEHEPSGALLATDAPKDNMGQGAAFSPTDLVAAALASCAVTTMAIKARGLGIELGSMAAAVEKFVTTEPPRRIAQLQVTLDMPRDLPVDARSRLEEFARTCPVALSLGDHVRVEMVFRYF